GLRSALRPPHHPGRARTPALPARHHPHHRPQRTRLPRRLVLARARHPPRRLLAHQHPRVRRPPLQLVHRSLTPCPSHVRRVHHPVGHAVECRPPLPDGQGPLRPQPRTLHHARRRHPPPLPPD